MKYNILFVVFRSLSLQIPLNSPFILYSTFILYPPYEHWSLRFEDYVFMIHNIYLGINIRQSAFISSAEQCIPSALFDSISTSKVKIYFVFFIVFFFCKFVISQVILISSYVHYSFLYYVIRLLLEILRRKLIICIVLRV